MIERQLVEELTKRELTIGSVESFTGGLFAATLTNVPGVSQVFRGALVTYASALKSQLLEIKEEDIRLHGVVSKEIAKAMAEQGRARLLVDICVSFTGNAGPTALDRLPVGRCFIGIAFSDKTLTYELQATSQDRNEIRLSMVELAIKQLLQCLREQII